VQWDIAVSHGLVSTLLISGIAAVLAPILGSVAAYGLIVVRPFGWRVAAALLASFLLVPVYVQATAWSAGFGSQGWLRLSQVDAAKNPWYGIAAVVWIHTAAATPFCFFIVSLGLQRGRDAAYEQALVEMGPAFAFRQILFRKLFPWILAASLWTFCSTQNDMVVTNLFQVPTLCESVYQQVQFGKLRAVPITVSLLLAMLCGICLAIAMLFRFPTQSIGDFRDSSSNGHGAILPIGPGASNVPSGTPVAVFNIRGKSLWALGVWGIVFATSLLPFASLITRVGWESRIVGERAIRSWSVEQTLRSIVHVTDFSTEFGWSFQLAIWSSGLAVALALLLIVSSTSRTFVVTTLFLLGFALSLPGPLVNLTLLQLFNRVLPDSWSFIAERTLIGPILALQFRCLPIAYGILLLGRWRYESRHGNLIATDKSLPWWIQQSIWLKYATGSILTCLGITFFISFGDLASYLLIQPPGVTTVAMRMFELLHYGIRNREASVALVLAIAAAIPSLWLTMRATRDL
jgi:ABC-type Fe3+ transport system permease subunit